jgi:prepilin-type N-terminal cleavage/methylation domain-containing protein
MKGFTLLEVMIALAIMAVLSLLSTQAFKSAIDSRAFVSRELNRDSQMADTLRIIRNDIQQAFHYQDIFCKMENDLLTPPTPTPGPNGGAVQQPPPLQQSLVPGGAAPGPTPKPCPVNFTGFIGDKESVYFTALSNVRTLRDSQESDQAKIGYFVKSCRTRGPKPVATQCLYRSVSPILDEDLDKPGQATLLLENVEEFKIRYLGPEREDFVDTWKTGKNGDDISKDKFPYAIEVTLTIIDHSDPKDRAETQTTLIPIFFQNNPKKKTQSPNQGTGQGKS